MTFTVDSTASVTNDLSAAWTMYCSIIIFDQIIFPFANLCTDSVTDNFAAFVPGATANDFRCNNDTGVGGAEFDYVLQVGYSVVQGWASAHDVDFVHALGDIGVLYLQNYGQSETGMYLSGPYASGQTYHSGGNQYAISENLAVNVFEFYQQPDYPFYFDLNAGTGNIQTSGYFGGDNDENVSGLAIFGDGLTFAVEPICPYGNHLTAGMTCQCDNLAYSGPCNAPCGPNMYGQPGACSTCPPWSTSPSQSTSAADCICMPNTYDFGTILTGGIPDCVCLLPGATGCIGIADCPANTFGIQGSCTNCPALTNSPLYSSQGADCTCVTTVGVYYTGANDGNGSPICACVPGWEMNGTGSSASCVPSPPCAANTFGQPGFCKNCPTLSTSNANTIFGGGCTCLPSSAGVYPTGSNIDGSPICACQSGWAISADGSSCLPPCPVGTFGTPGSCQNCPLLSTSLDGTTSGSGCTCLPSATGVYATGSTDNNGSPICACEPQWALNGNSGCTPPCLANTFGQPGSCTACPPLLISPIGSLSVSDCVCLDNSQLVDPNGNCYTPCPANTYGEGASCTTCPRFSISSPGSTTPQECVCGNGSYQSSTNTNGSPYCACPTTSRQTATGCFACPANSQPLKNTCRCLDTNARYNLSRNTCQCTGATFKDPTSSLCVACGTGTDPDATGCVCLDPSQIVDANGNCYTPCPANTYGDGTSCTACPRFSSSPSGSTTPQQCLCANGSYQASTNADGSPDCGCPPTAPVKTLTGCLACPADSTVFMGYSCMCQDPNAVFTRPNYTCECRQGWFQNLTIGLCVECGTGTNPYAAVGAGCVCLDTTQTLDVNNNCIAGVTATTSTTATTASPTKTSPATTRSVSVSSSASQSTTTLATSSGKTSATPQSAVTSSIQTTTTASRSTATIPASSAKTTTTSATTSTSPTISSSKSSTHASSTLSSSSKGNTSSTKTSQVSSSSAKTTSTTKAATTSPAQSTTTSLKSTTKVSTSSIGSSSSLYNSPSASPSRSSSTPLSSITNVSTTTKISSSAGRSPSPSTSTLATTAAISSTTKAIPSTVKSSSVLSTVKASSSISSSTVKSSSLSTVKSPLSSISSATVVSSSTKISSSAGKSPSLSTSNKASSTKSSSSSSTFFSTKAASSSSVPQTSSTRPSASSSTKATTKTSVTSSSRSSIAFTTSAKTA